MFSRRFKNLTPYVPGEQPQDRKYIKLNTNENPYPPSPAIREMLNVADTDILRRYPDPVFTRLRAAISDRYGVSSENVFAGNGSDEVLSFVFHAFFDSENGPLLFPQHTYSFYPVYCDFYGIDYQKVALDKDYGIDVGAFIGERNSCGVIIPNPNAPTGIALPPEDIRKLLDNYPADRVVAIDEAYVDFGGNSAVDFIDAHENLIVIRTLSKSMSLAGMRLGFAMGSEKLISALYTVKDSFNSYPVNTLTQEIGTLAMEDEEYYRTITEKIINTRVAFTAALEDLGWRVLPSSANFVFARKPGVSGKQVYETLKSRGILVRFFDKDGLRDFVRITIGTDEEMEKLTAEAADVLN